MEIDRAEINREENIRQDRKQADQRRQSSNVAKQAQTFEAHYKSQLKNKLDKEVSETQKREAENESKKNELSFQRVLEVSKKKEDQKKEENFVLKKKEDKKEKDEEKISAKKTESSSPKEEQNKKVDSISEREGGRQGGGSQGGSGGGSNERGDKGSGGFSGGDQSKKHFEYEKKALSREISKKTFTAKITSVANARLQGSKKDSKPYLSDEAYQEIIKKVSLVVSENKEAEMQIELDNSFFGGLKLTVSKTKDGVSVLFLCPNWEVKKLFLSHKLSVYAKLKEAGIHIKEVDVK